MRAGEWDAAILYIGEGLHYLRRIVAVMLKKRKKAVPAPARSAILDELKGVAAKLGLVVREEKLLREIGYRVRSGRCRVGEEQVIFLDRNTPPESQLDVLIDELVARGVDGVYLSPAARSLIDRAARRETDEDGKGDARGG